MYNFCIQYKVRKHYQCISSVYNINVLPDEDDEESLLLLLLLLSSTFKLVKDGWGGGAVLSHSRRSSVR